MANFLAQFQSIKTSSGHLVVAGIFYFFPILKAAFLHSTDLYSAWLNWKCYSAFSVFELFYVIIHELKEDYSVVALLVSNLWAFKITFFSWVFEFVRVCYVHRSYSLMEPADKSKLQAVCLWYIDYIVSDLKGCKLHCGTMVFWSLGVTCEASASSEWCGSCR